MRVNIVYKIAGIAFSLGSLVYFYQAVANLNFVWPWFSLAMSVGGICFLAAGLSFLVVPALQNRKKELLMQSGVTIEAQFLKVDFNWKYSINGQHPYIIFATGVDTNGQQRTFKSANIWSNPASLISPGQKIKVFIDPNKPKKYWLDISFLDNPTLTSNS